MNTTTSDHRIQIDAPTWGDYLNGGYGDLVAQCSCGQYEYVSSQQEGLYWHWLHRTNTQARGGALLRLLVDNPMPEGWAEPAGAMAPTPAKRRYTCPSCMGSGYRSIGGGGINGRFYNYGFTERSSCADCGSAGRIDLSKARELLTRAAA